MTRDRDRESVIEWIKERSPNADYFLSIQLPKECKTIRLETFESSIRQICRYLERELLGRHWITKAYRFDGFYEKGKDLACRAHIYDPGQLSTWHAHILLTCPNRTAEQLKIALDRVGEKYRQRRRTCKAPDIVVKSIYELGGVVGYCTKQLGLGRLAHIRSNQFFSTETLFNIG